MPQAVPSCAFTSDARLWTSVDNGVTWQPALGAGGGGAAGTATSSNVAGSNSSVTLLSANALRIGFTFFNESSAICYVKLGAVASNTSYMKQLLPNDFLTSAMIGVNYTGRIDAIWASTAGTMRIVELSG